MRTRGSIKGGGIYMIKNIITQDMYIGRTVNFTIRRTQHKNLCKRAKTGFLYENMRLYKPRNFVFSVLEKVEDRNLLDEREAFWFEKLNPYYNVLGPGGGKNRKTREIHIERKNKLKEIKKEKIIKERAEKRMQRKVLEKTILCMNCGNEFKVNYTRNHTEGEITQLIIKSHSCGISIMDSPYLAKLEKERKLLTK